MEAAKNQVSSEFEKGRRRKVVVTAELAKSSTANEERQVDQIIQSAVIKRKYKSIWP